MTRATRAGVALAGFLLAVLGVSGAWLWWNYRPDRDQWIRTVHQVTAELDFGPILAQAVVPIVPGDTADDLAARVLTQEHQIYPRAIAELLPSL